MLIEAAFGSDSVRLHKPNANLRGLRYQGAPKLPLTNTTKTAAYLYRRDQYDIRFLGNEPIALLTLQWHQRPHSFEHLLTGQPIRQTSA